MTERNDCAFYSEIQDMNATVPCCDIYGFGNCKCFDCKKYVSKDDRVLVVRCKDCRRYATDNKGEQYCPFIKGLRKPKPDDFCSYGERKDNE